MSADATSLLTILLLGVATYAMRVGGYLLLSRFDRLDRRVEAGLDAVPASVIAALVAPAVFASGAAEVLAAAVTILAALRLHIVPTLLIGATAVSTLRALGL